MQVYLAASTDIDFDHPDVAAVLRNLPDVLLIR